MSKFNVELKQKSEEYVSSNKLNEKKEIEILEGINSGKYFKKNI